MTTGRINQVASHLDAFACEPRKVPIISQSDSVICFQIPLSIIIIDRFKTFKVQTKAFRLSAREYTKLRMCMLVNTKREA